MNPAIVQRGVFGVLDDDATLVAMLSSSWGINAIFADTPQVHADDNDYYPFVSFGAGITTPFDTKTSAGGVEVLGINVWSRSGNYIEAKDIAARVWGLLHRTEYTLDGADLTTSDMESVVFELDPDGETRRGRIQLRVTYETDQNVT